MENWIWWISYTHQKERESEEKKNDVFIRTCDEFALQVHESVVVRVENKTTRLLICNPLKRIAVKLWNECFLPFNFLKCALKKNPSFSFNPFKYSAKIDASESVSWIHAVWEPMD